METLNSNEIDQDLSQKIAGLKALAATHTILNRGSFPISLHSTVEQSIDFMQSLHEQLLSEAILHPQADLVPELKLLKDSKEEKKD